jgi:hypothetical protein
LIFDHNRNLWAPQTCAYATLRQSVANLMFCYVSFNFATAISKFDTFSSYHIVRARIAKVKASFFLFELSELVCIRNLFYPISFSHFALSELVCTKNDFTLFYYSLYFLTPSFFPFGAFQTDGQKDRFLHPLLPKLFFFPTERAGPYPQAQLYWAGRTMGWMAD